MISGRKAINSTLINSLYELKEQPLPLVAFSLFTITKSAEYFSFNSGIALAKAFLPTLPQQSPKQRIDNLSCCFNDSSLPDDCDLYVTRISHLILNFVFDFLSQCDTCSIINFFRQNHNT